MRIRYLLLASLLLVLFPPTARGQYIALYPATDGGYQENCNFVENTGSGLRDIAVVASPGPNPLAGIRLSVAPTPTGWTPLSILSDYTWIGWLEDLAVSFNGCLPTPIVAATLRYFSVGNTPCGRIYPGPATGLSDILVAWCDYSEHAVSGVPITINGIYDVPPGGFDPDCFCPTVGTEQSTWGKVKALYRN